MKYFLFIWSILCVSCLNFSYKEVYVDASDFEFAIISDTSDCIGDNPLLLRGAAEQIKELGQIDFVLSTGDTDYPWAVKKTLNEYIRDDILWYPAIGNHDADTVKDMLWYRHYNRGGDRLPNIKQKGLKKTIETMYSFDYSNVHFVIINQYYNGQNDCKADGRIHPNTIKWLRDDLFHNNKDYIFVVGHEPAYVFPDDDTKTLRHADDCLNKYPIERDNFWNILSEFSVTAYICGHTHCYSSEKVNEVWQINIAHTCGYGDISTKSTFIHAICYKDQVQFKTYRLNFDTGIYDLYEIIKF